MAKNILAARLRLLVAEGILEMRSAADRGAYNEYFLTEKGRALFPVLVALRQWGEEHLFEGDRPATLLVEEATGVKVPKMEVRAADGRALRPEETALKPMPSVRERRTLGGSRRT